VHLCGNYAKGIVVHDSRRISQANASRMNQARNRYQEGQAVVFVHLMTRVCG
jgi:hypothetical protein